MAHKVSIVIVNFNQARLALDCIESIVKYIGNCEYEIILVDNGSSASETEVLKGASDRVHLIFLDRNMFFGEASNIGAERATGDLVLFLNNDIKVTAGWIEPLIHTLETEYCAGAVGPKTLHPNNELLEAGAVIRPDGWGVQVGKGGTKLPPDFIEATRIVDYCSGACLLMSRQLFLDLGGFDPIFDPAYFEDVDLAIRLRSIGLFTYYCGASVVYHEESVTSNRIWSLEQRNSYIAANHERLMRRWGRYLQGRLEQDLEPEALASIAWQPESGPATLADSIVLYSSAPLKADAKSQSLLRVAAALQDYCDVIVATHETYSRCRIYSLCREFGITLSAFRVRQISALDQKACRLIISFGAEAGQQLSAPHLAFERHGPELLHFVDDLTFKNAHQRS